VFGELSYVLPDDEAEYEEEAQSLRSILLIPCWTRRVGPLLMSVSLTYNFLLRHTVSALLELVADGSRSCHVSWIFLHVIRVGISGRADIIVISEHCNQLSEPIWSRAPYQRMTPYAQQNPFPSPLSASSAHQTNYNATSSSQLSAKTP